MYESKKNLEPTARELAEKAYAEAGNYQDAATLLEKWARKDESLWKRITDPLMYRICLDIVRKYSAETRKAAAAGRREKDQVPAAAPAQ